MGKVILTRPVSNATRSFCLNKPLPKSITISKRSDEDEAGVSELLEKLKSVVPTVSGKSVDELTSLDIMQHAIEYIYDLSYALNESDNDEDFCQYPSVPESANHERVAGVC